MPKIDYIYTGKRFDAYVYRTNSERIYDKFAE